MKPQIRVLVVEDSITVRKYLCEVLSADRDLQVVGEAGDGKSAIEMCRDLRPDVATLDMMLPIMSGLAATEYIMAHFPTPILIVSASTNRGEMFKTYEALAAGAVDVLDKPTGDEAGQQREQWEQRFVATVKLVSRIKVITHPRARLEALQRRPLKLPATAFTKTGTQTPRVIGIGASTGGPAAILEVFRALPPDFSIPILLVIHIGHPFGPGFAEWLDGETAQRVVSARNGDPISGEKTHVTVACPDQHMSIRDGRIRLTSDPPRHSCRPSVDVLFESIARECGSESAACLLTGMGRDGAAGLLQIREAGGMTIAQDEATSVVYGMPKEAVINGAAQRVLPIHEIGQTLAALHAVHRREPHE